MVAYAAPGPSVRFEPRGPRGLHGLTFDGTGLLGTGLFCWPPDDVTCSWGIAEAIAAGIGIFALYSIFFTSKQKAKEVKSGLETAATRRRKSRAAKLRARAQKIESSTGFGGLF